MPRPSNWFIKALGTFDPLLSVRWGVSLNEWIIERVARIPEDEVGFLINREARLRTLINSNPEVHGKHIPLYRNVAEETYSARHGKRVVISTPQLTNEVFNQLMLGDIQRYGGYSRYADYLEAQEARAEADAQRQRDNTMHALNLEVADMMEYVWRKRDNALLNGHRNMQYLVHGKESSEPLIQME